MSKCRLKAIGLLVDDERCEMDNEVDGEGGRVGRDATGAAGGQTGIMYQIRRERDGQCGRVVSTSTSLECAQADQGTGGLECRRLDQDSGSTHYTTLHHHLQRSSLSNTWGHMIHSGTYLISTLSFRSERRDLEVYGQSAISRKAQTLLLLARAHGQG